MIELPEKDWSHLPESNWRPMITKNKSPLPDASKPENRWKNTARSSARWSFYGLETSWKQK